LKGTFSAQPLNFASLFLCPGMPILSRANDHARIERVSRPRTPNSRLPIVSQEQQDKYRESDISIPSPMVRMRLYVIPENLRHITYRPLLAKWSGSPGQYSDIQTETERIPGDLVPAHEIGGRTPQIGETLQMPAPNKSVSDATVACTDKCEIFRDSASLVTLSNVASVQLTCLC
jgi:hypothetical protein